jgi:hypothetical protein
LKSLKKRETALSSARMARRNIFGIGNRAGMSSV